MALNDMWNMGGEGGASSWSNPQIPSMGYTGPDQGGEGGASNALADPRLYAGGGGYLTPELSQQYGYGATTPDWAKGYNPTMNDGGWERVNPDDITTTAFDKYGVEGETKNKLKNSGGFGDFAQGVAPFLAIAALATGVGALASGGYLGAAGAAGGAGAGAGGAGGLSALVPTSVGSFSPVASVTAGEALGAAGASGAAGAASGWGGGTSSGLGSGLYDAGLGSVTDISMGAPMVGQGAPLAMPATAGTGPMALGMGGMPTAATGLGVSPSTAGGLSSMFQGLGGGSGGVLGTGLSPLQLGSGLYDLYSKNKIGGAQMDQYNAVNSAISGYGAPGSPEYEMMKQELERKDAAAGRNSQYGPRAVDLAARMAGARMTAMSGNAGNQNALLQAGMTNQTGGLNSLFGYASKAAQTGLLDKLLSSYNFGG